MKENVFWKYKNVFSLSPFPIICLLSKIKEVNVTIEEANVTIKEANSLYICWPLQYWKAVSKHLVPRVRRPASAELPRCIGAGLSYPGVGLVSAEAGVGQCKIFYMNCCYLIRSRIYLICEKCFFLSFVLNSNFNISDFL